ncbi:DUF4185 domain-containing protein [Kitasatospora sp. NPDC096128]|uniref:DUF4185 domain-containing protein n=1 Tax=Kitasatospora sp. NPDC096128 TaxID=3155547 RepID=UPI003330EB49
MTPSSGGHDERTGGPSRRQLLKIGIGVAVGAGAVASGAPAALANGPYDPASPTIATKLKNLSGPVETGPVGAPWTDLGIPVQCPDGTMLFVCGDTFDGDQVFTGQWNAPVGLRSSSADLNNLRIDGIVRGAYGISLVDEPHTPVGDTAHTTAIPSDAFVVDGVMYMPLMRGVIYDTHHTDFWRSTDNGQTWEYLCQWPGDLHGGQFQQKTYAVADDGYCYVLSTVFNRDVESGMLLHRVRKESLGTPDAYEPWGYADGTWQWNAPAPTTVFGTRKWGEICFRAMDGKYVLTWLNTDPLSIRAMVFALPTSDLTRTLEQAMILPCAPGQETANFVASPYGGFVIPGSTFGNFHIVVSQWYDLTNYRIMQYRINMLS